MTVAALNAMNDALSGTERVLNTPLPLAYRIAISQITWVYVLVLPFQLFGELRWITIPGTISNEPLIRTIRFSYFLSITLEQCTNHM